MLPPTGVYIYLWPHVRLQTDHLTPKVDHFMTTCANWHQNRFHNVVFVFCNG